MLHQKGGKINFQHTEKVNDIPARGEKQTREMIQENMLEMGFTWNTAEGKRVYHSGKYAAESVARLCTFFNVRTRSWNFSLQAKNES